MIRRVKALIPFLLTFPLYGVGSVTFTDQSGSTQTNRPISIHRIFKCGDIPNFPRPSINGTPATNWQSDVHNRWGSPTLCADGSAKEVDISVLATVPASSTITIDFLNNTNPCSSGNQAACDAAALSIANMQALSWNVQIEATASSITKTANARTILNACGSISLDPTSLGCRYYLKGPIRTSVILEDRDTTRAYDFGWTCTVNCTNPYASATWVSDPTQRTLHPMFNVDFWNGTTNIQYRAIAMENMWSTHRQDQAYALSIKTGNALSHVAYSKAYFVHYNRNRWRQGGDPNSIILNGEDTFWDSTAPGAVQANLNWPYFISTGAVPNYDTSLSPNSTNDVAAFVASTGCGPNGHSLFDSQMGDTGGRPELGIIPGWYVRAFYTMNASALRMMELMGDCQGNVQVNFRDSDATLFYDSSHTVSAFGRTFSVDAHPTVSIGDIAFPPVGPVAFTSAFIGFNLAHQPNFNYGGYLVSGDWYSYESMLQQASNDIQVTDPTTQPYGRNGAMGLINGRAQQLRGQAWGWRDLIETTAIAIDGSPESGYMQQKLANNIGAWEGWYNITNGIYNGSTAWLFGRNIEAVADPNPLRFPQWPDCCAGSLGWLQPTVQQMESPLEMHFLTVATGHMVDMGYPFQKVQQVYAAVPLNMALNPVYNPYLLGAYRVAEFLNANPNRFITSWATVKSQYSTSPTNYQTATTWPVQDQSDCNAGFTHYSLAAISFLANLTLLPIDGGYSGANAWAFVNAPGQGISNAPCTNANPMWAFLPRSIAPASCSISGTLPNGIVGASYGTQTLTAQNCGGSTLTWTMSTGALPGGLTGCSSVTGVTCSISGTPTTTSGSPFAFTVKVTDGTVPNTAFSNFTVAITSPNTPPTITSTSPLPNGTLGTPYSFNFAVNGTAPITVTATGLPGWATLSTAGLLSGTPNAVAVSTIAVTATNIAGSAGPTNFSLTIPGVVPVITSTSPLPGGTTTVPYSFQFAATGTTPITWGATGLPGWAMLSSGGLLTGTPNAIGNITIAVTATNATGNSGPHNFTLNVVAASVAPTITSTSPLPSATFGTPYSFQFAVNGTAPITCSTTALPAWASLSGSCLLSGTPNAVGVSTVSVTATNSVGSAGPTNFSLTIAGVPPTISSASPLPGGTATVFYSFQFTASGSPAPAWIATGVPTGLTFSGSGLLSGTPTVAGTTSISVTATNSAGSAGPTAFSLNISPAAGGAPSITSTSPLPNCVNGTPCSFQFQASGTTPFTWSGTGIPTGFTLSPSGLLSGSTTTLGTSTLAISVSNSAGSVGPKNFSFTVVAPSTAPLFTTTSPLTTGIVGTFYSNQIVVTGNPTPTCSTGALPSWATLTPACLLSGTPTAAGSSVIFITAVNSFGTTGPTSFTLPINQAPSFLTVSPLPAAINGTPYSFQFQSSGTPTPTYLATGVPTGLTLSAGGLLSGTPTVNATSNIAVTITNAAGSAGPTSFSITVSAAATSPAMTTTSPLPTAVVGQFYSTQFTGTGSPFTWTATGLPPWASFPTTGLLTGTPTPGSTTSTIAVTLTNAAGADGPTNFSLPVIEAPQITVGPSGVPGGGVGVPFAYQFTATGSPAPTWSATGLPGWASINATTGILSGTPNAAAITPYTITATNSAGVSRYDDSLIITATQLPPVITSPATIPSVNVGTPYNYVFTITGTLPITCTATGVPDWATFNTATCILTGIPNAAAVSTIAVTANNAAGSDGPHNYSLTVTAIPTLDYTITTTGPQHIVVGNYGFFNVLGTILAGTDENVTPTMSGLPSGVSLIWTNLVKVCCGTFRFGIGGLNPAQLTVSGSTTPGTYTLVVTYNTNTSHVIRTTTHTLVVDPVPGPLSTVPFPSDVPLSGLAQYNANMLSFGANYCTPPLGGPAFEGFVWYYDGIRVMWQIADYTSNPSTWNPCALGLDALYRTYVTNNSGNVPGYHVFPKGLAMSYKRTGITADKTAIQLLQTNGYANFGDVSQVIDWLLSREISYGLETNLEAEGVGIARIANFQNVVEVLIGDMDQWFQSQTANYVQPFMVALASEALIQYYEATGDVRIPPLLKLAADRLWAVSFDPLSNSLMYYNYNAAAGPPPPQPYPYLTNCSNLPSFSFTCKGPSPDLNLLIVPIFGWVYQHTGDVIYRTHGDTLFNAGVSGGFLGAGKQFSQNYRWSMRYLTDRVGTQGCDLNQDGKVNVQDVQLAANMSLGLIPCTANINGAGVCNSVTIQRVVTASLGGTCVLGP